MSLRREIVRGAAASSYSTRIGAPHRGQRLTRPSIGARQSHAEQVSDFRTYCFFASSAFFCSSSICFCASPGLSSYLESSVVKAFSAFSYLVRSWRL